MEERQMPFSGKDLREMIVPLFLEQLLVMLVGIADTLGSVVVKLVTNSNGVYLGDKSFDPLMEELNRRNALVIIHPCRARKRPENVITGNVVALYEYPADTTRAVLNMIANRIMTRFPQVRFVVPHTGSFLPYMLRMVADDSHIVYGSDFPHSPAKVVIGKKKHFEGNKKYQGLVNKIFRENASRLL